MTIVFDGNSFAKVKEQQLTQKVFTIKENRITPKLVSILVGDDPASILYTALKRKAAERIGAIMEVKILDSAISSEEIIEGIKKLNDDTSVHGIMIQMPLPAHLKPYRDEIVNSIKVEKDVDGLRENSNFIPATVKAVVLIMKEASKYLFDNVVVVGSSGMVGKPLVKLLKELEYKVIGVDIDTPNLEEKTKKADLIISATGKAGLITPEMVKDGVVVIDVGSPKPDVELEVAKKASFITPVPGGVGPVTIISLLDNLIIASQG